MNYSFIIRKAQITDAEAIQQITKEAFTKYIEDTKINFSMDALNESIEDIENNISKNEVFVAFIDESPVGSVRISINYSDNTAYLYRFGVRLDYHNIGIGKALINLVDKMLISKGIKKVYLHTASKYFDLIKFYYSRGFYIESTSTEKGYIRALLVKEY